MTHHIIGRRRSPGGSSGAVGVRSAKKCRNKASHVAALVPRSSIADAYLLLGRRWGSVTWSGFAYAREHEIVFDPFSSSLSAFTVPDLSQVGVQSKLFLAVLLLQPDFRFLCIP